MCQTHWVISYFPCAKYVYTPNYTLIQRRISSCIHPQTRARASSDTHNHTHTLHPYATQKELIYTYTPNYTLIQHRMSSDIYPQTHARVSSDAYIHTHTLHPYTIQTAVLIGDFQLPAHSPFVTALVYAPAWSALVMGDEEGM